MTNKEEELYDRVKSMSRAITRTLERSQIWIFNTDNDYYGTLELIKGELCNQLKVKEMDINYSYENEYEYLESCEEEEIKEYQDICMRRLNNER